MASKGRLSGLQVRILQLALAQHKEHGGNLLDYSISTTLGEEGTPEAQSRADLIVRCKEKRNPLFGERWLLVEQDIRMADASVDRWYLAFEVPLQRVGGRITGMGFSQNGVLDLIGCLPAAQWRQLRPLLNELRKAGFSLRMGSYGNGADDVTLGDVLKTLYKPDKTKIHAATVAASRSLNRLQERGLLFRDTSKPSYYRLTGEGYAVALGEASPDDGCILEAASELQPARKKGRPRRWHYQQRKGWEESDLTKRGEQDKYCAAHAALAFKEAIGDTRRFAWIFGGYTFDDQGRRVPGTSTKSVKVSLAAELGRLIQTYSNGVEVALKAAEEIISLRPRIGVKEAVRFVRDIRRVAKPQTSAPGTVEDLEEHLYKALADYMERRHDTSPETIRQAIEVLAEHCEDWTD